MLAADFESGKFQWERKRGGRIRRTKQKNYKLAGGGRVPCQLDTERTEYLFLLLYAVKQVHINLYQNFLLTSKFHEFYQYQFIVDTFSIHAC